MLPTQPSFERLALNRATFGARAVDEAYVQAIGWDKWVAEQLSPPAGDDPELAQLIANATLHIQYQQKFNSFGGWPAVNENRPLTALNASDKKVNRRVPRLSTLKNTKPPQRGL